MARFTIPCDSSVTLRIVRLFRLRSQSEHRGQVIKQEHETQVTPAGRATHSILSEMRVSEYSNRDTERS